MTFEIFTRNNGRFYYRTIADIGHNLLSSDGYETKKECMAAIEQVQKNILNKNCIEIEKLPDDEYKFRVFGNDGTIVGYSMDFHSKKQCEKWIEIMKNNIPVSEITEIIKVKK